MNDGLSRILLPGAVVFGCLFTLYLAISRPGYFNNASYLGGLIFLQFLVAAMWNYRQRFFPLLMGVFLWAGMNIPLSGIWTAGRWVVLSAGAAYGFVLYMREHRHHFGVFHLLAFFCVVSALVSALVSQYPGVAFLKALSLLLLFLYGATGARLAIAGREEKFFRGLLLGIEILVYLAAGSYFVLGLEVFGNPNSLGAVMGVVAAPLLLWGALTSDNTTLRRRGILAFMLSVVLLFFSLARAGMLAGVVSSCLLCVALRRYKLLIQGLVVALLLALVAVAIMPPSPELSDPSLTSVFLYKGHREAGILGSRESPWQKTVSLIQQHPWFGRGFGTSPTSDEESEQVGKFASSSKAAREHGSSYLAITEWLGLLGVAPFLALTLLIVLRAGRVLAWLRRTGNVHHPAVPIVLVLTAGLIHAAFEDWLLAVGYYLCVFFWTLAFALVEVLPATAPAAVPSASLRPSSSRPFPHGFPAFTPRR